VTWHLTGFWFRGARYFVFLAVASSCNSFPCSLSVYFARIVDEHIQHAGWAQLLALDLPELLRYEQQKSLCLTPKTCLIHTQRLRVPRYVAIVSGRTTLLTAPSRLICTIPEHDLSVVASGRSPIRRKNGDLSHGEPGQVLARILQAKPSGMEGIDVVRLPTTDRAQRPVG
jgi:hypothetical protein